MQEISRIVNRETTNIYVKIPYGWRELRAGDRIRLTDRFLQYNGPRFVPVSQSHSIKEGDRYIKHSPGNHWTIIRRIAKKKNPADLVASVAIFKRTHKPTLENVLRFYKGVCQVTGKRVTRRTARIDHILPRSHPLFRDGWANVRLVHKSIV